MSDLGNTSAAATAPAFADAAQTADNQKQALLAAIAQAGAAGKQQFASAQNATAADRQAALQAATAREAVVQNMPPALAQQLGAQVSAPYNQAQDLTNQGEQAFNQNIAQQGQAAGNYLGEVKAAVPVVQADVQGKIAALQAAAQAKAQADAQARAIQGIDLQKAQLDLQTAQAQASNALGGSNISKLVTALGGPQVAGTALGSKANQLALALAGNRANQASGADAFAALNSSGGGLSDTGNLLTGGVNVAGFQKVGADIAAQQNPTAGPADTQLGIQQLAQQLGISPDILAAVIQQGQTKTAASQLGLANAQQSLTDKQQTALYALQKDQAYGANIYREIQNAQAAGQTDPIAIAARIKSTPAYANVPDSTIQAALTLAGL